MILIIALLNDGTIMTLSVDHVLQRAGLVGPGGDLQLCGCVGAVFDAFEVHTRFLRHLPFSIINDACTDAPPPLSVIIILEMTFQDKFGVTPDNITPNPVDSNDY
jgi:hypothetical protein